MRTRPSERVSEQDGLFRVPRIVGIDRVKGVGDHETDMLAEGGDQRSQDPFLGHAFVFLGHTVYKAVASESLPQGAGAPRPGTVIGRR